MSGLSAPQLSASDVGWIKRSLAWAARRRELLSAVAAAAMLALAFVALDGILDEVHPHQIRAALHDIPPLRWALALGFTVLSYLCLTLYDWIALRTIGARLPYRVAAAGAAASYAISNTLGFSLLTGGSVRMAIYRRAGLPVEDVARVVAIASAAFWGGVLTLFGLALALVPADVALAGVHLPGAMRFGIPLAMVGALIAYGGWTARAPRTFGPAGAQIPLPGPARAAGLLAVAAVDLAAAAGVVFVLAPGLDPASYPHFLVAYVLALGLGVLAHTPGGIGVFEAAILLLLPTTDQPQLVAALICYRLVYYLLPFLAALLALVYSGRKWLGRGAAPILRAGTAVSQSIGPTAVAGLVFAVGAILVLTGSFPAVPGRIRLLANILPNEVFALSHLAASLLGTALLFVAYGLSRRLDGAYRIASLLLAAGALAALLRGLDYFEAGIALAALVLLRGSRRAFHRQSALFAEPPGTSWVLSAVAVVMTSIFAGLFVYKGVAYRDELWWQVHPTGNAARFLRAGLAVALLTAWLAWRRLLQPPALPRSAALPPGVFEQALASADGPEGHLARTGDKLFLVAASGDAFLMYRQRGKTLIAMGDPVGPQERWAELAWALRTLADRQGARIAFYECSAAMLPLAIDLGLSLMKLGEEAVVDLAAFTLAGPTHAKLRQAVARAEREGSTFRLLQGDELRKAMRRLRQISGEWLADKKQQEKQFSLGRFDPAYLAETPVAVIEQHGTIVAFANLWPMTNRAELSVDLMRHSSDAPPGTMDFLFASLMNWGKEQGYRRFSLGIAPLSGIVARPLAPFWARVAGLVFRHGEAVYGYAGLRRYKDKFRPEWRGRYFAAPHGYRMALALIDVTLLISGPGGPPRGARASGGSAA